MKTDTRAWLTGKRARGYLRVSSKGQADRYGPAAQRKDELEAATAHETRELTHFYEDHVTATNALKRSDFQKMVADARAKAFDVLYVGRVDRFARNERDAWNYLHDLEAAGAAVYFVEEDVLVPHDPDWQDKIGDEVNGAAAYVRKLRRNVTKGLRAKWAAGGHVGGVPFGYTRTADKLSIEPNADIAVRKLAFELYATGGFTMTKLAEELNSRGLTIDGRPFRTRAIWAILSNPIVIGKVRFHIDRADAEIREDLVAPVISVELWEAAQRYMIARSKKSERVKRRRYVFSGVARCATCSERLYGSTKSERSPGKKSRRLIHSPRGCKTGSWSEAKLERIVGEWLQTWDLAADAKMKIVRFHNSRTVDDGARVRRQQLEAELGRVTKLFQWQHIAEDAYLIERRRITVTLDELPPDVSGGPSDEAIALATNVGALWPEMTPAEKRRFIDQWFDEIHIGRRAETIEFVPAERTIGLIYASSAASACRAGTASSREAEGTAR
jgi:DNA invertase Pin-like site-specific DNA recombinase